MSPVRDGRANRLEQPEDVLHRLPLRRRVELSPAPLLEEEAPAQLRQVDGQRTCLGVPVGQVAQPLADRLVAVEGEREPLDLLPAPVRRGNGAQFEGLVRDGLRSSLLIAGLIADARVLTRAFLSVRRAAS